MDSILRASNLIDVEELLEPRPPPPPALFDSDAVELLSFSRRRRCQQPA